MWWYYRPALFNCFVFTVRWLPTNQPIPTPHPPTHPPTYLSTYLPTHPPTYLPTYIPTYYLPTYLPTHPPTRPSIHPASLSPDTQVNSRILWEFIVHYLIDTSVPLSIWRSKWIRFIPPCQCNKVHWLNLYVFVLNYLINWHVSDGWPECK